MTRCKIKAASGVCVCLQLPTKCVFVRRARKRPIREAPRIRNMVLLRKETTIRAQTCVVPGFRFIRQWLLPLLLGTWSLTEASFCGFLRHTGLRSEGASRHRLGPSATTTPPGLVAAVHLHARKLQGHSDLPPTADSCFIGSRGARLCFIYGDRRSDFPA